MLDIKTTLDDFIDLLNSDGIISAAKTTTRGFTQTRKITLLDVLLFYTFRFAETTNKDISALFSKLEKPKVSKQGMFKALNKLNPNVFPLIINRMAEKIYNHNDYNTLDGYIVLACDGTTDNNVLRDLNQMENSGNYLLNLINDTLDVSKIESGKFELHPIVSEGKTFFNDTMQLVRINMESKNIHYHIHTDELPFTILYDDIPRIKQVIMNVVSNAVKFTPEEGTIDITRKNICIADGVITDQIIVKDSGIGMSKEFIPHIFEPFSQEDSSRTSNATGTGLGMSITKEILQLMGGDIAVESELGKGTCITITLNLHIATKKQIEEWKKNKNTSDYGTALSGKRILLFEDHPLNAQIAARLLEVKDMIVEHAENGQIGLDMFQQSIDGYYDAILMDIRMPVMDGINAAKAIRNLPRRDARMIPIIAMTANAFKDDVEQTQKAGMDAHLSKPIEKDILYHTLACTIFHRPKLS